MLIHLPSRSPKMKRMVIINSGSGPVQGLFELAEQHFVPRGLRLKPKRFDLTSD